METRASFLHLMVAPALAFLACNGLTLGLLSFLYWGRLTGVAPSGYLGVVLCLLYGVYLHFFRSYGRRNYLILFFITIAGFMWVEIDPGPFLWFLGLGTLFVLMKGFIQRKNAVGFCQDLLWVGVGGAIALFLYPINLFLSVTSFYLVQILSEIGVDPQRGHVKRDPFYEGQKMAEHLLRKYGV